MPTQTLASDDRKELNTSADPSNHYTFTCRFCGATKKARKTSIVEIGKLNVFYEQHPNRCPRRHSLTESDILINDVKIFIDNYNSGITVSA